MWNAPLYEIAPVITGTELSTWYESSFVPPRAVGINYDWNWVVSRLAFVIFWLKISRSRVPRGLTDVDKLNKSFVAHPRAKCHSHASLFHEISLSVFLSLLVRKVAYTHARASVSFRRIIFIALKYVITRPLFPHFSCWNPLWVRSFGWSRAKYRDIIGGGGVGERLMREWSVRLRVINCGFERFMERRGKTWETIIRVFRLFV